MVTVPAMAEKVALASVGDVEQGIGMILVGGQMADDVTVAVVAVGRSVTVPPA